MFLAPLNYDRYFKKVFSDEKISRRFLEDFLDVEIEEIEKLNERHSVTDDAAVVEFDYRCKIGDAYVIIDMQQWFKRDIGQRFYLYHALNTGLQLEDLPLKNLVFDKTTRKLKKVKDYRALEPVFTLIWMVTDALMFSRDYVSYLMTPEVVIKFIKNERLWRNPEIVELLKEREKVLEVLQNQTKGLDFIQKNRLIFMFQGNIVKNKTMKKYDRWFEFAEKTRNENNKEEDFQEYGNDEIFSEMIRRLRRDKLTDEDFLYIENEKKFWEEMNRLEHGIYEDGKKDGEKIGIEKGEKIGIEKTVRNMLKHGMSIEDVVKITGFNIDDVKEIMKSEI